MRQILGLSIPYRGRHHCHRETGHRGSEKEAWYLAIHLGFFPPHILPLGRQHDAGKH